MTDSADITQARQALGRQLASLRLAAGHTQHSLAPLLDGYSRSTLANAETGQRGAHRDFWVRCDEVLATGGTLTHGFDQIESTKRDQHELRARTSQVERVARFRQQQDATAAQARAVLEGMASQQNGPANDEPLDLLLPPIPTATGHLADADYVEGIRRTSQRLVTLDGQHGADDIASLAVRSFRAVHHRLGTGAYQPKIERDLQSAAAELAEVAGWLLYDADRHAAARQLNTEALHYAHLAGDRGIEQLTLNNMGNHAVRLQRPAEALAIARRLRASEPASPRLQAMVRLREAQALAASGQGTDARRAFAHTKSLFQDGLRDSDPPWAWWISEGELALQEAKGSGNLGDRSKAADLHALAVAVTPTSQPRDRLLRQAFQLEALVNVQAWADAETLLSLIMAYVGEIGSRRTASRLLATAQAIQVDAATPGVVEGARWLRNVLESEGYGG